MKNKKICIKNTDFLFFANYLQICYFATTVSTAVVSTDAESTAEIESCAGFVDFALFGVQEANVKAAITAIIKNTFFIFIYYFIIIIIIYDRGPNKT